MELEIREFSFEKFKKQCGKEFLNVLVVGRNTDDVVKKLGKSMHVPGKNFVALDSDVNNCDIVQSALKNVFLGLQINHLRYGVNILCVAKDENAYVLKNLTYCNNVDWCFIDGTSCDEATKRLFFKNYASFFGKFEDFCSVLDQVNGGLAIYQTVTPTPEKYIFWYKTTKTKTTLLDAIKR
jgi:hypothetical protein